MKKILIIAIILFWGGIIFAQDTEFDITQYPVDAIYPDVPEVEIVTDNLNLMRAFYPQYYDNEGEIRKDIRFVHSNDSAFTALWDSLGYTILTTMTSLSGIDWIETKIPLHLMKYLPVDRLYDPATIPLEGIRRCDYIEAAPTGLQQLVTLVLVLAGRNLQQIFKAESSLNYLADHPLLQSSAYRFDVMAMTLAVSVSEHLIIADSLNIIFKSAGWNRHNPGWEIYDSHFRDNWFLSSESPLVSYLTAEPYNSPLVEVTRPPRVIRRQQQTTSEKEPIKLSAGGGRFGFSVTKTPLGLLEVTDIDSLKLAYASGLQAGDQIKRVNGEVVRNARELMGKIIDNIDTEGVYMIVLRDEQEVGILLLPPEEY